PHLVYNEGMSGTPRWSDSPDPLPLRRRRSAVAPAGGPSLSPVPPAVPAPARPISVPESSPAPRPGFAVGAPPPSSPEGRAVLAVDPLAGLELPVPRLPRLRAVEPRWVRLGDELRLWLRDPLELSDRMALVPEVLLPLLAMLDGTHDARALAASFGLRTGIPLSTSTVETILRELDEALLLEGPRYERAVARLLAAYRALPHRPPALAGRSYPDDPDALDTLLEAFVAAWQEMVAAASTGTAGTPEAAPGALGPIARAAGVLSPHIDYGRGGLLYAGTWQAALAAVASAEVIVIFGTDHAGGPGRLTPTAQRYATPWGALEVDRAAV